MTAPGAGANVTPERLRDTTDRMLRTQHEARSGVLDVDAALTLITSNAVDALRAAAHALEARERVVEAAWNISGMVQGVEWEHDGDADEFAALLGELDEALEPFAEGLALRAALGSAAESETTP